MAMPGSSESNQALLTQEGGPPAPKGVGAGPDPQVPGGVQQSRIDLPV